MAKVALPKPKDAPASEDYELAVSALRTLVGSSDEKIAVQAASHLARLARNHAKVDSENELRPEQLPEMFQALTEAMLENGMTPEELHRLVGEAVTEKQDRQLLKTTTTL